MTISRRVLLRGAAAGTAAVFGGERLFASEAGRFAFADPIHPYMYHCHILEHEDAGMMGQFVVV